jgi:hypothetical protein
VAIDTRSKRASSVNVALPFRLTMPLPDGTIGAGDRQHMSFSYSGISAAASVSIQPGVRIYKADARRTTAADPTHTHRADPSDSQGASPKHTHKANARRTEEA